MTLTDDELLDRLKSAEENVRKSTAQAEHFEREWYLRGDEIERLRGVLTEAWAVIEDDRGRSNRTGRSGSWRRPYAPHSETPMLAHDDLRGIAEELRCNAEALRDGHTLRGEWHDDDAKREHDKLIRWADALVAVHAGPIKTHETIDWSRLAAEISADYPAVVRERDALRTKLREADSLHNRLADILHRSVANLRGEPPELVRWGCNDLPERIAMMRNVLRRAGDYIRNRREPGDRVLRAIDRILGEAAPELGIDIDSLQCLADIRAALGDSGQMTQSELVEQIRRMAADARRYRWLRDRAAVKGFNMVTFTYALGIPQGSSEDGFKAIPAEQLDAAIDAAMAKES